MVEEGTISSKKCHCQWIFLRGKKPKWIFHNLGNLSRPLGSIPASRKRVVPTEWQVRTILGVITVQAPQYRQHALISDSLDLANLSVQEEAALATNWIDERPEEPCVSRHGRTSNEQFTEKSDCGRPARQCKSLGPGKQWILHGNPAAKERDFPPYMTVLRRHFLSNAHFLSCIRAPSVAISTSLQQAVNPLLGCSSGKPVQDQPAREFVMYPKSIFQHRI